MIGREGRCRRRFYHSAKHLTSTSEHLTCKSPRIEVARAVPAEPLKLRSNSRYEIVESPVPWRPSFTARYPAFARFPDLIDLMVRTARSAGTLSASSFSKLNGESTL